MAPVLDCLSLPARSTKFSRPTRIWFSPSSSSYKWDTKTDQCHLTVIHITRYMYSFILFKRQYLTNVKESRKLHNTTTISDIEGIISNKILKCCLVSLGIFVIAEVINTILILYRATFDGDDEDGMWPWAVFIHVSCSKTNDTNLLCRYYPWNILNRNVVNIYIS